MTLRPQASPGRASAHARRAARPLVVGLGGTTRRDSGTERVLRAGLDAAARHGARTVLLAGPDLDLPMYTGHAVSPDERARRLVEHVRRADGVIIASPAYHGGMSGLVKNALDHLEELREDVRPYLDGRAVGCIACAGGWQAAGPTLAGLRSVAHALRGWPTPLGVAVNTSEPVFGGDGAVTDAGVLRSLDVLGAQVVALAGLRAEPAGGGGRSRSGLAPAAARSGRSATRVHPRRTAS